MKNSLILSIIASAVLLSAGAFADDLGEIRPDPEALCPWAKPHELFFDHPRDQRARTGYASKPFYAVILKSASRCNIDEDERKRTQAMFPHRKIFSVRFECGDDVEENLTYTNVNA